MNETSKTNPLAEEGGREGGREGGEGGDVPDQELGGIRRGGNAVDVGLVVIGDMKHGKQILSLMNEIRVDTRRENRKPSFLLPT